MRKQHPSSICNTLMSIISAHTETDLYRTRCFCWSISTIVSLHQSNKDKSYFPTSTPTRIDHPQHWHWSSKSSITLHTRLTISPKSANIGDEIQHIIRCAYFPYGWLKDRVFSDSGFRTATEIHVYKSYSPPSNNGLDAWVAYRRHVKTVEQLQQRVHSVSTGKNR